MPIQRQQMGSFKGMEGIVTLTAALVSREEALSRNSERPGMTMSELAQCSAANSITFPNPFGGANFSLPFEEIKRTFPDADFDNSIITADIKFQPDPTRNPTLYPSDMVDQLRSLGFPEAKIQALIAWEQTVRGKS